jgi:hypothetical protein
VSCETTPPPPPPDWDIFTEALAKSLLVLFVSKVKKAFRACVTIFKPLSKVNPVLGVVSVVVVEPAVELGVVD